MEEYKELYIHPQWENWSAFDPKFRWTWREERSVRRKVDWKIMVSLQSQIDQRKLDSLNNCQVWVCIMFAALNIDRNNISNAVSDNMLDDLGLTKADYVSWFLNNMPKGRRTDRQSSEHWSNNLSSWFPCCRIAISAHIETVSFRLSDLHENQR